ncbi:hypothetical protein NQ038_06415 [Brevibacterium sp. 50QC2O2]|uniref:hypothetical protein n=1 Tax=Brevibacterium TaxID=1696 RepID=UPI00211B8FB5|nr:MULTISPECIES: hypothetical protein [unclassified Brevibacterium]MCQ9384242.1 hypothetical protein [Brevibacterium sp. 68QC2CO]MCQ9388279.1 hypothetical protein [Brevibacterium sp. 50QC2O2]
MTNDHMRTRTEPADRDSTGGGPWRAELAELAVSQDPRALVRGAHGLMDRLEAELKEL